MKCNERESNHFVIITERKKGENFHNVNDEVHSGADSLKLVELLR